MTMTWAEVSSKIQFWTEGAWTPAEGNTPETVSNPNAILTLLGQWFAGSTIAQAAIEKVIDRYGVLRIGDRDAGGLTIHASPGSYDGYLLVDSNDTPHDHWLTPDGHWVESSLSISLLHEIMHLGWRHGDPPRWNGVTNQAMYEAAMNGQPYVFNGQAGQQVNFDYDGEAVHQVNLALLQRGLGDQQRSSYQALLLPDNANNAEFQSGISYTDAALVSFSRIGFSGRDDNMDISSRTDGANALMFGLDGDDTLKGGSGNDFLYGGDDADTFIGGAGNDHIWGGDKTSRGSSDGVDVVDYSKVEAPITVMVDNGATDPKLTVSDGQGGSDTLRSIERVLGTSSKHDELKIEGSVNATIDLTAKQDGYSLVTQGSTQLRVKGFEEFTGGEGRTTFKGNGESSIFHAGTGGGEFYLTRGDSAYGQTGAVDRFYLDTKAKAGLTSAEACQYLESNRVFIGNFNANEGDKLFIKINNTWVEFNGNCLVGTLQPTIASDRNADFPVTTATLSSTGSYGSYYPQPTYEVVGSTVFDGTYGSYTYEDARIRDASYRIADESGLGLITFMDRGISGHTSSYPWNGYYTLDALAPTDEMLTVVIEGFTDGDGGINFGQDALANVIRPNLLSEDSFGTSFNTSWDPEHPGLPLDYDDDGNVDEYAAGGGPLIDADDPRYNLGDRPFEGQDVDWAAFILPPQTITGTDDDDVLSAGWAADSLSGGDGNDVLHGLPGDDVLDGGAGNDELFGEDGDDTLLGGSGDDALHGGNGSDIIDGGDGNDTAFFDWSPDDYRIYRDFDGLIVVEDLYEEDVVDRLENVETLQFDDNVVILALDIPTGTPDDDNLVGSYRPDIIYGLAGNDTIDGDDDDDELFGNDGTDALIGGNGDDFLDGGLGADQMTGGDGDDVYLVDDSGDVVTEGEYEGEDSVLTVLGTYTLSNEVEHLTYTGPGAFTGTGNALDNFIISGAGDDTLAGLDGDDTFEAGAGDDFVQGGSGYDTVRLSGSSDSYVYTRDSNNFIVISNGTDSLRLSSIESAYFEGNDAFYESNALLYIRVTGTEGDDAELAGDEYGNHILGLGGNDLLLGRGGDDRLDGGSGTDTAGYDDYSWNDYSIYWNRAGALVVEHVAGDNGRDELTDVEFITFAYDQVTLGLGDIAALGTSVGDVIAGTNRSDRLYGFGGDDDLTGGFGDDELWGDDGDDTLSGGDGSDVLEGGTGADILNGGDGHNTLNGGGDADIISGGFDNDFANGGSGNDIINTSWGDDDLRGGAGNDALTGGGGDDLYHFALGDGQDVLADSDSASWGGYDVLEFDDISASDVIVTRSTNGDDFILTFVGSDDSVTLSGALTSANSVIEMIRFSDWTEWSHADLVSMTEPFALTRARSDDFQFRSGFGDGFAQNFLPGAHGVLSGNPIHFAGLVGPVHVDFL